VVLPQNPNLRELVPQRPAVQEERELGGEGDDDGDDGGQVEVERLRLAARVELARREGDQDQRHGDHDEAEADVAGRLDAGLARGELARVHAVDGLVADEEGQVGQGVEDGIGHGGEQGQRAGRDGAVHLHDGQDHVGREAAVHGDLVLELVLVVELPGRPDVLLHGLEHPPDVLILRLVEVLQLLGRGGGPHVVLEERRRTPAPLPRRVGLDLLDLMGGLDLGRELERVVLAGVPRRRLPLLVGAHPLVGGDALDAGAGGLVEGQRHPGGARVGGFRAGGMQVEGMGMVGDAPVQVLLHPV